MRATASEAGCHSCSSWCAAQQSAVLRRFPKVPWNCSGVPVPKQPVVFIATSHRNGLRNQPVRRGDQRSRSSSWCHFPSSGSSCRRLKQLHTAAWISSSIGRKQHRSSIRFPPEAAFEDWLWSIPDSDRIEEQSNRPGPGTTRESNQSQPAMVRGINSLQSAGCNSGDCSRSQRR